MVKWSLGSCVSLGCAKIPLKRDIIAVMQPFGVEVALNKNLIHSLENFKMLSLVSCNSCNSKDIWAGPLPKIIYLFFFPS